jgi:hypothetical protein
MRIFPLVLAVAFAAPAIGLTQDVQRPVQVAAAADTPKSFEDPNEPTQTPAGGNPTPTIVEIGVIGVGVVAVAAGLAGGGDDNNAVGTTGTTGTR